MDQTSDSGYQEARSSANCISASLSETLCKSFMYSIQRRGPNVEPCDISLVLVHMLSDRFDPASHVSLCCFKFHSRHSRHLERTATIALMP